MAIERIQKLTICCPSAAAPRVMRAIHRLGVVEITDAASRLADPRGALHPRETSTEEADEKLYRIDYALGLLDNLVPKRESFFEGLTPLPLVVSQEELDRTVCGFDLDAAFAEAKQLDEANRHIERAKADMHTELAELAPVEDLPFALEMLARPKRTRLLLGTLPAKNLYALDGRGEPWNQAAWEIVLPARLMRRGVSAEDLQRAHLVAAQVERVRIVIAVLASAEAAVREGLAALEFEETPLPALRGSVRDRMRELQADLAECEERSTALLQQAAKLAEKRRALAIMKAFWLSTRNRKLAGAKGLQGRWVSLICGYICASDVPKLERVMQHEISDSTLELEDPAPDEEVPVRLNVSYVARPVQVLVNLFGLPAYQQFDPSPFILVNFFLFFGICFSDVGYGLMLVALSTYLMRRTRPYPGVYNFSRILLYAGCSTVLFGALLGSWFGDLYKPEYLGEGNVLLWLQSHCLALDPVEKTIPALLIALGIGMANQFYGISLKMYGALRHGDRTTAICDGLLWLIALPGLVILCATLFAPLPPILFRIGLGLFAAGALGLALTQGRDAKNPVARLLTGVVSIYGIVGSYGCTAFIGDVLSYCRLLALGLTTCFVAQTFNMLAGMLREIPWAGPILFVIVLVFGHIFNFAISLLGAFVHSMRLIFVEFFGRFYEGGARPFEPLGFDSPLCVIEKPAGK